MDVKWIKIVTDLFDDEKILLIESQEDADAIIVIWFKLLCLAGKQNNHGVFMLNNQKPYTEEMLSIIMRRPLNQVQNALRVFEQYGMIEKYDDVICIPNWEKHQSLDALELKRQRDREYQKLKRDEQKSLAENNRLMSDDSSHDVATMSDDNRPTDKIRVDKNRLDKNKSIDAHILYPDYSLSEKIQGKIDEWLAYKAERKEKYQEVGLKSLLRQLEKNCEEYGDAAICDLIDLSMSNNWKGIIFEKLEKNKSKGRLDWLDEL